MIKNQIKERLMFFDILRIIAIVMVVYQHVLSSLNMNVPSIQFLGESLGIGKIGVIIFIVASGSVLYLSSKEIDFTLPTTLSFYYKRFVRLYPAMWISFVIAIVLEPQLLQYQTFKDYIVQLTGTTVYFLDITNPVIFYHLINPIAYFISLIVGLYLMYPIIHTATKYYPTATFLIALFISTTAIQSYNITIGSGNPFAYLMFFVSGIYIAHIGIYPKTLIRTKGIVVFLSNITFYIFLAHGPVLNYWVKYSWNKNFAVLVISFLLVSSLLMFIDDKIQMKLKIIERSSESKFHSLYAKDICKFINKSYKIKF